MDMVDSLRSRVVDVSTSSNDALRCGNSGGVVLFVDSVDGRLDVPPFLDDGVERPVLVRSVVGEDAPRSMRFVMASDTRPGSMRPNRRAVSALSTATPMARRPAALPSGIAATMAFITVSVDGVGQDASGVQT